MLFRIRRENVVRARPEKKLMFDGYILVGGASSRMKTNKAALRLGAETFAERAVSALREITGGRIHFITGARPKNEPKKILPPHIQQLADVVPDKAALGGIYTALAHCRNEWAVVLACDYPFAGADLFARLAEIAASVDKTVSAIAPVQPDGRVQPLCAFYRAAPCLPAAEQLIKNDSILPARRLLDEVAARLISPAEFADLRGAENFFENVNTPEDFQRVQNIYQAMRKTTSLINLQ